MPCLQDNERCDNLKVLLTLPVQRDIIVYNNMRILEYSVARRKPLTIEGFQDRNTTRSEKTQGRKVRGEK
jgi:hypothetical protein